MVNVNSIHVHGYAEFSHGNQNCELSQSFTESPETGMKELDETRMDETLVESQSKILACSHSKYIRFQLISDDIFYSIDSGWLRNFELQHLNHFN